MAVTATAAVATLGLLPLGAHLDGAASRPVAATAAAALSAPSDFLPVRDETQVRTPVEVITAAVAHQVAEPVALVERGSSRRQPGRASRRMWRISSTGSHDLPTTARRAYERAAARMRRLDPGCQLPWTLLAGIGRVESDHGRYGGARLSTDGVSRPGIIGIALNGRGPVAAIPDTDGGRHDGDTVWDRAVGPMQFIPGTWHGYGADGDRDGRANPQDLDDAALASAKLLCAGPGSLMYDANRRAAVFRYNHSDYYVALVLAFEAGYRTGVFDLPAPPVEAKPEKKTKKKKAKKKRGPKLVRTRPAATTPVTQTGTSSGGTKTSGGTSGGTKTGGTSGGTKTGGTTSGGTKTGGTTSGGTKTSPSPSPTPTTEPSPTETTTATTTTDTTTTDTTTTAEQEPTAGG